MISKRSAPPPTRHFYDDQEHHRTEPATVTVLTHVREMIVTGKIAPNSRLRAESIASELGVSRTPVRSALAVLAAEGLVTYSLNRGYTVRELTFRDVLDATDIRAVLESRACGLSVDYGWSADSLELLEETVRKGRAIIDAGQWSEQIEYEWYALNRYFHQQILAASGNSAVRNALRMTLIYPVFGDVARLSPAVALHVPQRHRAIPHQPPHHVANSQSDHEHILQAIKDDDAPAAERLMLEHVLRSKARLAAIATRR